MSNGFFVNFAISHNLVYGSGSGHETTLCTTEYLTRYHNRCGQQMTRWMRANISHINPLHLNLWLNSVRIFFENFRFAYGESDNAWRVPKSSGIPVKTTAMGAPRHLLDILINYLMDNIPRRKHDGLHQQIAIKYPRSHLWATLDFPSEDWKWIFLQTWYL